MSKMKWGAVTCFLALAIIACAVPVTTILPEGIFGKIESTIKNVNMEYLIVLDPGHGGMDGGAESLQDVCEKDINLAIAFQIKKLAEADGWKIVMTRETDQAVRYKGSNGQGQSIRSMKTEDLLARKERINKVDPLLTVSIHLNSYKQDTSVKGAQTFYTTDSDDENVISDSKNLGETIQKQLVSGLNDGNHRIAMGKKDVLLLKDAKKPIVIVECGFLSNSEEADLLQKDFYQKKLAENIYKGILEFAGGGPEKPIRVVESNL